MFDADLIRMLGMWPNPYLYYFYYAERAVAGVATDGRDTWRGDPRSDRGTHRRPQGDRHRAGSGEAANRGSVRITAGEARPTWRCPTGMRRTHRAADRAAVRRGDWSPDDEEGYAAVMLDVVEALESGRPLRHGAQRPERRRHRGAGRDDVVEVSCRVDRDWYPRAPIGAIPRAQLALIEAVKAYERLTVRAIAAPSATSRRGADGAPAGRVVSAAAALVADYLDAHRSYLDW